MTRRLPVAGRRRIGVAGMAAVAVVLTFVTTAAGLAIAPPTPAAAESTRPVTLVASGINRPRAITAGPDGNLWFTNLTTNSVSRMTPAGAITSFHHPGIDNPGPIAAGPGGSLWFLTSYNSIGRVTTDGTITLFPGSFGGQGITAGPNGWMWFTNGGDDSIGAITPGGAVAKFEHPSIHSPRGIITGPDGNLWFANHYNSIGRITPQGVVLPAFVDPAISYSSELTLGPDGNVWFVRGDSSIGRITPAGQVTTFPTTIDGIVDIVTGPDGNLWFGEYGLTGQIGRMTTAGVVTVFDLPTGVNGLAPGPDGNVWFVDEIHDVVGKVTPTGASTTFTAPQIRYPDRIVSGPDGNLWFTSHAGDMVSRLTPAGVVTAFTGAGVLRPHDITVGPDGNLWFTNAGSIGRITPAGVVSTFTGPDVSTPWGITAGPDGNVWFTNYAGSSIGRISPAGVIDTFADPGISGPWDIVTGPDGNLWFTNELGNSVGRITPVGVIDTFTGTDVARPHAIVKAPNGEVWFGNTGQGSRSLVQRVSASGVVSNVTEPNETVRAIDLAVGPDGNVWFTADVTVGYLIPRFSTPDRFLPIGVVANVVSSGKPQEAGGLTTGPDGAIWFAQGTDNLIARVSTGGPDAPTAVVATSGDRQVSLTWTAPASSGLGPITGYTITPYIGAVPQPSQTAPPGATSAVVTGLTNGTTYSFTVAAENAVGRTVSRPTPPVTPTRFADVPVDAPFYADIEWLVEHGITSGYDDRTFRGTAPVSRQALAAFLYRSTHPDGASPTCGAAPFPDVPVGAPFCGEIAWLVDHGIARGYADGYFHPAATVSRQAAAAFLYRFAGLPLGGDPPCPAAPFPDVPAGAPFCGEIAWLVDQEIADGYADGTFRPTAAVSRQATAAFLHRLDGVLHP